MYFIFKWGFICDLFKVFIKICLIGVTHLLIDIAYIDIAFLYEAAGIVDCIAHTHIDIEWLWARNHTREKIQRSFTNALALMKKYPEFKFMLSQPELYRYLKEKAPKKYEELKQLVKEGRWNPKAQCMLKPTAILQAVRVLCVRYCKAKSSLKMNLT